jgi:histone-lysine N-methyltransferase SETMAR
MKVGSIYDHMIQRPKSIPRNGDSGSPCPKNSKTRKFSSKVLAPVFLDKDEILLVDYLGMGASIMAKYYVAPLDKLKQQVVSKRRGKLSKGILFLQDSAAPHKAAIIQRKLAGLHFEVLTLPAYSPDLAPSEYYLFPNLKKHLREESF